MRTTSFRLALIATLVLIAGVAGPASADTVVYATISPEGTANSTLGTLDLTTGQFTAIAPLAQTIVSLTAGAGGTLYAGAFDGNLYTVGAAGLTRFGSVVLPPGSDGIQGGFFGLAYAGQAGFYALDQNYSPAYFDQIAADGNSFTQLASQPGYAGSGGLAFGPDGLLYELQTNGSGTLGLYRIDPATGDATLIGTGVGIQDYLTLVTADGQLYGIDTAQDSGPAAIDIYTINTTTGVATATGVAVTGLPTGYTLDTAASVPEPATLTLALAALATGLGVRWHQRSPTSRSPTFSGQA